MTHRIQRIVSAIISMIMVLSVSVGASAVSMSMMPSASDMSGIACHSLQSVGVDESSHAHLSAVKTTANGEPNSSCIDSGTEYCCPASCYSVSFTQPDVFIPTTHKPTRATFELITIGHKMARSHTILRPPIT